MKKILLLLWVAAQVLFLLTGCGTVNAQEQFDEITTSAESQPCSQPPMTAPTVPVSPADPPESPSESAETEPVSTAPDELPDAFSFVPAAPSLPEYAVSAFDLAILEAVNQARAGHGLPALILDDTACRLAFVRATEAASQWSHTRPNGQAYHSVFPEYEVPWPKCVGENLANHVVEDAQGIVDAWMQSEGHRRNILHPDFTGVGIAVYYCGEKHYIANLFVG